MTKPPITVHGSATAKTDEASTANRGSPSARARKYVGTTALAKSTPFSPCTARTASGMSINA